MDNITTAKLMKVPTLKRGKSNESVTERVKLERVLGVTVSNNSALDSDSNNETIAYPAGCTVILFNTTTGNQTHIINTSRKTITSLAFSSCGRYLVTGECGHQPAVRVWDLQSDPQPGPPGIAPQVQQVAEFFGHKYGISCVAFSPTNKYVVSIGTQHDMIVNVWNWRNNVKIASNKVSTKIKAIAFAENGSYFVTVGNRHVKFWFLEYGNAKYKEAVPLMGRSAILGEQRNNYFCDVACGKGQCGDSTYAITRSGLLCEFNNRRLLDKWVELRTTSANCITVGENYIFVGCAEGIVRCFDPVSLRFITTLPRTHYLGVDVSQGLNITHMSSQPANAKYPDTIACKFDEVGKKLTCIYNDHSIYVWDVHNVKRVGKSFSFLYHSACIWGVEMAPQNSPLPPGSFLTCSSDDTIRVWTLDKLSDKNARGMYQKNIYSNELLKVVYVDKELNYLKDLDLSFTNPSTEKTETSYDGRNGVRSIRISPDGTQLASGDRTGNIRIHETKEMKELCKIEAHDAEVLCLEYTNSDKEKYLASASRDRLIHVFDVNREYNFLQTLEDHSSSITAVRFLNTRPTLQMVSCGADKSLIFRSIYETAEGIPQFSRNHNAIGKTTFYDMEVDSGQKHILTACQDRNVRIYSVATGKHTRIFKGTTGEDGSLIKVVLDRSGIYLATSCTDKSLSVYDYYTGECMATMCGHSELATGLRFTNDCRRLISASGDGCIFVWRVPHDMVVTMHARLSQQAMRQGKTLDNELFVDSSSIDFYDSNANVENDYRFSVGALPLWAKKHIADDDITAPLSLSKEIPAPKGRWAQRAERSIGIKSIYTDSIITFPSLQDRNIDSDEKDSSLDSGTETRQYREKTISKQKISHSISIPRNDLRRNVHTDDSAIGGSVRDTDLESTAHEADIDSDQEYKHQPMYYPSQVDSASGSEFTVTNIDANELRKSQRRSKKTVPSLVIQPVSISGSQDSDEDEDEASTPSGENTDRNPLSMLSVSSESLDQIINREKYFQSAFESLSGGNVDSSPANKGTISSQYLSRSGNVNPRNSSVINAAKKTKNDVEAVKKREELAKRIADTRKKLQSVGFSPLKYSQSTHDLSHLPEKEKWNMSVRKQVFDNNTNTDCSKLGFSTNPQTNTSESSFLNSKNNCDPNNSANLQLCGCFLKALDNNSASTPVYSSPEIADNSTGNLNILSPKRTKGEQIIHPRKLQLDKTLAKYRMHKSLPVSPVTEERSFLDYVQDEIKQTDFTIPRKSFSYFVDLDNSRDTNQEDFRKICRDIEKLSENIDVKNDQSDFHDTSTVKRTYDIQNLYLPESDSFSSDSLEDYSFSSARDVKKKKYKVPKRSLSNNEIYKCIAEKDNSSYSCQTCDYDFTKSESFYLNPSNKNSQNSILSDDNLDTNDVLPKSCCNSLESILSDDSECKSAPLEILFAPYKTKQKKNYVESVNNYIRSLPKDISGENCNAYSLENVGGSLPKNYNSYLSENSYVDVSNNYFCENNSNSEGIYDVPRSHSVGTGLSEFEEQYRKYKIKSSLKTSQTQTEFGFETPEEIVAKKDNSKDFKEKLLKFETCIAQNSVKNKAKTPSSKGIAFFVDTSPGSLKKMTNRTKDSTENKINNCNLKNDPQKKNCAMYIPSLDSKNKQYESRFCNILNNRPEFKLDMYESPGDKTIQKVENILNTTRCEPQETTSLDRHLFTKNLLGNDRVTHKPPKSVRRHSSKMRKSKTTYEYVKKEDLQKIKKVNNTECSRNSNKENITTIEFSYKEKNIDYDCENSNKTRQTPKLDYFDSLDRNQTENKVEYDSLEVNLNKYESQENILDSLEYDSKNVWTSQSGKDDSFYSEASKSKIKKDFYVNTRPKPCDQVWSDMEFSHISSCYPSCNQFAYGIDKIHFAVQNIKILNEIKKKIDKINTLVEIFKENMYSGKVRALSSMYESLTNSDNIYNDLSKSFGRSRIRKRNLSLPNFVERHINIFDSNNKIVTKNKPEESNKNSDTIIRDEHDSKLEKEESKIIVGNNKIMNGNSSENKDGKANGNGCRKAKARNEVLIDDEESPDNSLRRSCSLSDLSMQTPPLQKPKADRVSGKLIKNQNSTSRSSCSSRYTKSNNSTMTRSRSTGVLNQSDSENESNNINKISNRLMRPTISSQNKVSAVKNTNIRKRHCYSVMNLSNVGQDESSSEETEKPTKTVGRSRSFVSEKTHLSGVARRLHNMKEKNKERKKSLQNDDTLTQDDFDLDPVDVTTEQLSIELCNEVAYQLTKAANNVVELYRRLTDPDTNSTEQIATLQKTDMVKNLELSIARTQKIFQDLTLEKFRQSTNLDVNQTDTVKKLNDLVAKGLANDQDTVVSMMQQFSDILLNMMQNKIQSSNT